MPLGLYEIPINYKPLVGNNPREWIRKKMASVRRIEERPIGNNLIPFLIRDIMGNTVGFSDPKVISQEYDKEERKRLYPNGERLARALSRKPTLAKQGRKHLEEVIGTLGSKHFTEYEYLARQKMTNSIVKLTKKVVNYMRIVLLVDHEQTKMKEKLYFEQRLRKKKELLLKEMEDRIPDEKQYIEKAVAKERNKIFGNTKRLLKEEISMVKMLKLEYLNKAYEFQMNWILKNMGELYQKKMNLYSVQWKDMFTKMKEVLKKEAIQENVDASNGSESDNDYTEGVIEDINRKWKDNILKTQEEADLVLKNVRNELKALEKCIAAEKDRRIRIEEIIETSNSIVQSIVEQYEKLITFACKGKPGLCNFFISFPKLLELNKQFYERSWERKKGKKDNAELRESIKSDSKEDRDDVTLTSVDDSSSFEIDQFKNCRDVEKINLFRKNVLKVENMLEEIRCAVLGDPFKVRENMQDVSVELKPISMTEIDADESKYVVDKLTDLYRLMQVRMWKSEQMETKQEQQEQNITNYDRVDSIVDCFKRNPELLSSFASV